MLVQSPFKTVYFFFLRLCLKATSKMALKILVCMQNEREMQSGSLMPQRLLAGQALKSSLGKSRFRKVSLLVTDTKLSKLVCSYKRIVRSAINTITLHRIIDYVYYNKLHKTATEFGEHLLQKGSQLQN